MEHQVRDSYSKLNFDLISSSRANLDIKILFVDTGAPGASPKTVVLVSLVPCDPDCERQQLCNLI